MNSNINKQQLLLIMNHLAVCGFALVYRKIKEISHISLYLKEAPETKINLINKDMSESDLFKAEHSNNKHIEIKTFIEKINENESEKAIERLKLIPELKPLIDQYSVMP